MANNEHGLDVRYFKEKLGLIVRDADNYSPDEMMRELLRLGTTAANLGEIGVKIEIKYPDE